MFDEAGEIFDFLPLNTTSAEEEYISHLWDAFSVLSEKESVGTPFAIMPFHLLFMLSLQYKIMRIRKEKLNKYKLAFTIPQARDHNRICSPSSVFEIGLLNEKSMVSLFSIIKVKQEIITEIKELVSNRNDRLAHAKGGIERNPEKRITEYIDLLKQIQEYILPLNERVAKRWLKEMETGQAGVDYMETHFIEEFLCPADMQQGKLAELDKRLNGEI